MILIDIVAASAEGSCDVFVKKEWCAIIQSNEEVMTSVAQIEADGVSWSVRPSRQRMRPTADRGQRGQGLRPTARAGADKDAIRRRGPRPRQHGQRLMPRSLLGARAPILLSLVFRFPQQRVDFERARASGT